MQPRRLRAFLVYAGSVVLGGVLLYLALRPVEFEALLEALAEANYWYLVPLAVVGVLSHVLRAWRWLLFADELPSPPAGRHPTLWISFASVMIGYMVNYAAPRLGEFARAGNLTARTRLPFSAVFGSIVVERVLDVVTLGVVFAIAAAVASRHMAGLGALFVEATDPLEITWTLGILAAALLIAGIVVSLLVIRRIRQSATAPEGRGRIALAVDAFVDGLASLLRTRRRVGLLVSTVAIWGCYLAFTYLALPMLGIHELTIADALLLLAVGAIGMMVPAPGGIGSYHYITILVMTQLLAVGVAPATAYAVLVHASQLLLYVAVGLLCLVVQGRGLVLAAPTEEPTP